MQLAEATGIPAYAISRVVRGEHITNREILERIADFLDLDMDKFFHPTSAVYRDQTQGGRELDEGLQTLPLPNGKIRVQLVAEVFPGVPALLEHLARHERPVSTEDTLKILAILTGIGLINC